MVLSLNVWSYKCKCIEWFILECKEGIFPSSPLGIILSPVMFFLINLAKYTFSKYIQNSFSTHRFIIPLPSFLTSLIQHRYSTDMQSFINFRDWVDFKVSQRLGPYFDIANLLILICRFVHFRISSHRFWREKLYKTLNDQNGK